jgi:hypothetical protein
MGDFQKTDFFISCCRTILIDLKQSKQMVIDALGGDAFDPSLDDDDARIELFSSIEVIDEAISHLRRSIAASSRNRDGG